MRPLLACLLSLLSASGPASIGKTWLLGFHSRDNAAVIRTLLVDDHAIVCKGLRALMEREKGDLAIAGECASLAEAERVLERDLVDVLVLDIFPRGGSGLVVLSILSERFPKLRILMLSMHEALVYVGEALAKGARANKLPWYLVLRSRPCKCTVPMCWPSSARAPTTTSIASRWRAGEWKPQSDFAELTGDLHCVNGHYCVGIIA